jgi:hypothetical protein
MSSLKGIPLFREAHLVAHAAAAWPQRPLLAAAIDRLALLTPPAQIRASRIPAHGSTLGASWQTVCQDMVKDSRLQEPVPGPPYRTSRRVDSLLTRQVCCCAADHAEHDACVAFVMHSVRRYAHY